MKLKGTMVLELTDTNIGEVERVEETNMLTNAVNHILGINPMGIFYAASDEYDEHVLWNDVLLPICPNMIGGGHSSLFRAINGGCGKYISNHSKTAGGICQ